MKKSASLFAILLSVISAIAQVPQENPTPPEPPQAPPPPASIFISEGKVTINDKNGNTYVITDYGVSRNGVVITGVDNEDLNEEIYDLREDLAELKSEAGMLSPDSDEYEDLMDDIEDVEDELELLTDMNYSYSYSSPDTLPDSTTIMIGQWHITVREDDDGTDNFSMGKYSDDEFDDIEDRYVDPFDTKWFLFDLGYNTYLNAENTTDLPELYDPLEDQQTWGSWDVNLHLFRQRVNIAHGYINFNYGLSFEWHNYRYNSDFVILPDTNMLVLEMLSDEGEPYDFKKNRFSTTHLTLPLILGFETKPWNTDKSFRMGFGYSPGLMIKGKTKIVEGGDTQKVKDDFNLEKFRHEVNYIIGFGGLNLYASYDLNGMFREGAGPELHPFSIGLIINRGF